MSKKQKELDNTIENAKQLVNRTDRLKALLSLRSDYENNISKIVHIIVNEMNGNVSVLETETFGKSGNGAFSFLPKKANSSKISNYHKENINEDFANSFESMQRCLIKEHLELEKTHSEIMISLIDNHIEKLLSEKSNSNSS